MSRKEFTRKAERIQTFVESYAAKLSRSSGFVVRKSKLSGEKFVQTLLLVWLHNAAAGLSELSYWASQLGVSISPQGIGKRFSEASVTFLAGLFAESLTRFRNESGISAAQLTQFAKVYLTDSSQIALSKALAAIWRGVGGCASPAALKIQLQLEYLSGSLNGLSVTSGAQADSTCELILAHAEPNSLHLFDLGYFKLDTFAQLAAQGAFFVSRFRPQTHLYSTPDATTPLALETVCRTHSEDAFELDLFMGATARLPVRVLFYRCPPAVAQQRRRTAKANARRKRHTCSAQHLALLDWSIFITNVPATRLDMAALWCVYRLRWQIELLFKLCKSQLALDKVAGCGQYRVLSQLYIRLTLFVLFAHLVAPLRSLTQAEVSLPKAFNLFSLFAVPWLRAIQHHWRAFPTRLATFEQDCRHFALKTQRRKDPSSLQALQRLEA
jgi:hypothetical protein